MLPLSHTYISTHVLGRKSDLLVLGSVLPDISTTSSNRIPREAIHNSPRKFYEFVEQHYPEQLDLGIGVLLHCGSSKGADHYSDNREHGFAYVYGKKIESDVGALLECDSTEKNLLLAHNFIEAALDMYIRKEHSLTYDLYKETQENLQGAAQLQPIIETLATYLDMEYKQIEHELTRFQQFLGYKLLDNKVALVEGMVKPLVRIRFDKIVANEKALGVLDKASNVLQGHEYKILQNATSEMKKTFGEFIISTELS